MASDADCMHVLTIPPSREVAEQGLPTALRGWFAATLGEPTLAQRFAWPTIERGEHLLLSSPTGTGKTLAAFMPILGRILSEPRSGVQCLYIAPLKSLVRDVKSNLKRTWRSMRDTCQHLRGADASLADGDLRIGLRTGDTSARVRQRQIAEPPPILLTTPESLAQMLAQPSSAEIFHGLRWIIVDEIHALVDNKRGADLAISLERLDARNERGGIQRVGLSATCTPLSVVAEYLVGSARPCTIAQVNDVAEKQFIIEPLFETLNDSPRWLGTLLDRLDAEITSQRTTLIFTNTRNLAERLTWALRRRYPDRVDEIGVHHSSLSAARRRIVERRLKQGRLWLVVSSTSLELGIDIGTVDCVVFVHPPGGVVRLLQRVGRSGHQPAATVSGKIPSAGVRRGILLTASPSELLESVVTASSSRAGQLEAVRVIEAPLDVLCQQIVGMAMTGLWSPSAAFDLIRRAMPYRMLKWRDFQDCLDYLSGRLRDGSSWLPARLQWEGECFTIADARTAKLLRRNLGTILTEDACAIHLRIATEPNEEPRTQMLGEVDDIYAERLQPGDRFVLDGRCLELKKREDTSLLVDEAFGRPEIPRWLGTGAPMSVALARRIYLFRVQAAEALRDGEDAVRSLLQQDYHLSEAAIAPLVQHLSEQETVSEIPTLTTLLIECVTMQSCLEYFVHTPLPRNANETLARVLVHRWKEAGSVPSSGSGGIPAMAVAGDLGIYLMVFAAETLAPDAWRASLRAERFADDLETHLRSSEVLKQHFARIAQTGLMVLRSPAGRKRKVGGRDWTARRLYEQIQTRVPDFVLLRQTEVEATRDLCDLPTARAFVENLSTMAIRVRHLVQPSPLGESLLRFGMRSAPITGETLEAMGEHRCDGATIGCCCLNALRCTSQARQP